MNSIREIFRIGAGPSSSHTMAPKRAAEQYRAVNPQASSFRVTLFGSLAATGRGHGTDVAILGAMKGAEIEIIWEPEVELPFHPNGMRFECFDEGGDACGMWEVYSVGGGALKEAGQSTGEDSPQEEVYPTRTMTEIMAHCKERGQTLWEYVLAHEGDEIMHYLKEVWRVMRIAIERGIETEGALPGGLGLARKASVFFRKAERIGVREFRRTGYLSAYALAVAEENAAGGEVVTAPTCGSCGVLPSVLQHLSVEEKVGEEQILKALATAGLVGALIKENASISGAEVGCQGEIGAACAMAGAAATQLMSGTVRQIEYAAEMGLEHHLGLTCDPIGGLVQIPCIERNALAATRAMTCAEYALFSDGSHRISLDEVVEAMKQTGHDLPALYRETSTGGLAVVSRLRNRE